MLTICFRCNHLKKTIQICIECRGMNPFCHYQCSSTFHRGNDGTAFWRPICQECYIEIHTSHLCLNQCEHEISCQEYRNQILQKVSKIFQSK